MFENCFPFLQMGYVRLVPWRVYMSSTGLLSTGGRFSSSGGVEGEGGRGGWYWHDSMENSHLSWGIPNTVKIIWVVVSICLFSPLPGAIPIWTNILQRGWNHQLVVDFPWLHEKNMKVLKMIAEDFFWAVASLKLTVSRRTPQKQAGSACKHYGF